MLVLFVILFPLLLLALVLITLNWSEQQQLGHCHKNGAEWMSKENIVQMKKDAKGVTVVEYAIMLALIAIAIAVSAPSITSAVTGVFSKASSVMK